MAVRTFDELSENLKIIIGERTDDDALAFIEDVTDTLNDAKRRIESDVDWEKKYHELDEDWRKRYRERFFDGEPAEKAPEVVEEKREFSDLFEVK